MPARLAAALALLIFAASAGATPPPIGPYQGGLPPLRPGQPDATGEPRDFAGMVDAHNRARRAVGVPPLQWSAQLAATAQSWANRLGGEGCAMRHSRASGLGENLAWASGRQMSPAAVVALWVDEARAYNRAANSCAPGAICGHYTQVVWRNTRFVGCGLAECGNSEVWVCNYSPPGNYNGERAF